jgi:signal transduction histidine kinase
VTRFRWLVPVGIGAAGLVVCAVLAAAGNIPAHDAGRLVAFSALGAAGSGLLAWVLLRPLRGSSIGTQTAIATLAPVLAVGVGIAWAASGMFIMSHDLSVLWVVLAAAGSAGLITAVLLGWRVADATRSVGDLARSLGEHNADIDAGTVPGGSRTATVVGTPPQELAQLATELEQTSARLAAAQQQTAALERSRRELVAWVSHDLRTPLAGIRAMVEALEDGVVTDTATVERYHRTMRLEADRLAGLVDDLFELSRIEAGALSMELERVALDELVADAVAGASIAAAAKGIELRGRLEPNPPVVELSTPEMARVVRNLLDNAIRHTPPGGTIWIIAGFDDTGAHAEVAVEDACGGIPEGDLDRVFDMAYRGDAARTPGDGGAGLGLAVARGLVEAHHGQISVRNEGDGCRFTVLLPLA